VHLSYSRNNSLQDINCITNRHSFKNLKVLLKIQWIFVHLLSLFIIRNFRDTYSSVEMLKGYMLICWNAERVHAKRKVGNPWSNAWRA